MKSKFMVVLSLFLFVFVPYGSAENIQPKSLENNSFPEIRKSPLVSIFEEEGFIVYGYVGPKLDNFFKKSSLYNPFDRKTYMLSFNGDPKKTKKVIEKFKEYLYDFLEKTKSDDAIISGGGTSAGSVKNVIVSLHGHAYQKEINCFFVDNKEGNLIVSISVLELRQIPIFLSTKPAMISGNVNSVLPLHKIIWNQKDYSYDYKVEAEQELCKELLLADSYPWLHGLGIEGKAIEFSVGKAYSKLYLLKYKVVNNIEGDFKKPYVRFFTVEGGAFNIVAKAKEQRRWDLPSELSDKKTIIFYLKKIDDNYFKITNMEEVVASHD